jgi:hypothetical protein
MSDYPSLAEFRDMAQSWEQWRSIFVPQGALWRSRLLAPRVHLGYQAAAASRETWELALSAAGYLIEREVEGQVRGRPSVEFKRLINSLSSRMGHRLHPRFESTAQNVATLGVRVLLRAAPRLNEALRDGAEFDFVAGSRLAYCMSRFAPDQDAVVRCVRGEL